MVLWWSRSQFNVHTRDRPLRRVHIHRGRDGAMPERDSKRDDLGDKCPYRHVQLCGFPVLHRACWFIRAGPDRNIRRYVFCISSRVEHFHIGWVRHAFVEHTGVVHGHLHRSSSWKLPSIPNYNYGRGRSLTHNAIHNWTVQRMSRK